LAGNEHPDHERENNPNRAHRSASWIRERAAWSSARRGPSRLNVRAAVRPRMTSGPTQRWQSILRVREPVNAISRCLGTCGA
jgi:hypothetical protein